MQRRHFLAVAAAFVGAAATQSWARGRGNLKPHKFTFVGKLMDRSNTTLTVAGKDADGQPTTIPFAIDTSTRLPANMETGDTVVVHYDYTLQNNVYSAAEVLRLPPGYDAPKSTFPDTRNPTDKT